MPDHAISEVPADDATIVEIRTTFPHRDEALACAERLVRRRLAACVQVQGPVTAVYRWQGAVETADEFHCTVKTSRERASACTAEILASHPYRTPELISAEVQASAAYAAWVRASVEATPQGGGGGDAGTPS